MKNKYLLPYAASLGALATMVFPVASLIWVVVSWDGRNPDGTLDNAPNRAIGLLLIISPVFLLAVFLGIFLTTTILHSRQWVTKRTVSILVLIFGSIIPVWIFVDYNSYYGIGYALKSFAGTWLFFVGSLSLGAIVWWKIYHKELRAQIANTDL